ncbi:MAG: deoxyribonuclease V [Sedimentisphaerales bacterium]|jgi:deoxyribonuclease V
METRKLHEWDLSYKEAIEIQRQLASQVRFTAMKKTPMIIAGLDCAFSKDGKQIFASAVVIDLSDFSIIETATAIRKVDFPYIPGLLSFREAPACIDAIEKLKTTPDYLIVDGQGFAHPRRMGIASHIGLLIDKPTIGCAKSRLIGTFDEPGNKKGSFSPLVDVARPSWPCLHRLEARATEEIGVVLRTRTDVKPVYVSIGHKCTLDDAISVVLLCTTRYRLPEPSRLAHQLVGQAKLSSR